MDPDEKPPYRVEQRDDVCRIADAAGRTVLECRDEANAQQYLTLLDRAYRAGYRAGYHAGKASARGRG